MSSFQDTLYKDLINLVETSNGSFITKDYTVNDNKNQFFRIFTYDLPKYSEFLKPNAKNCRGTMFFVDHDKVSLVALPMKKFFSLGEPPESHKLKISDAKHLYLKVDGSLLTTYICPLDSTLKFKSKNMPTFLDYHLVEKSITPELYSELHNLTSSGVSVDLELTTPENRVILSYDDYNVHVLKARNLSDGTNIDLRNKEFAETFPVINKYLVKSLDINDFDQKSNDIEGCIMEMENGAMYKVKTIPYLKMTLLVGGKDRSKDQEHIYASTLYEVLDEVRSLYHYKNQSPNFPIQAILENIDKVESYAIKTYRNLIDFVEKFHEENKHLDRKSYSFKAQEHKEYTSTLMRKYLGQDIDYKEIAISMYAKKKIP